MNEIRVLCVENRPEYMGALKYMLERAGYEVTPATTGDRALRLLTTLLSRLGYQVSTHTMTAQCMHIEITKQIAS